MKHFVVVIIVGIFCLTLLLLDKTTINVYIKQNEQVQIRFPNLERFSSFELTGLRKGVSLITLDQMQADEITECLTRYSQC